MDEYCSICGKLIISSFNYNELVSYDGKDGICNTCKKKS